MKTYKGVQYIVWNHKLEILQHYNAYIRLPDNHKWVELVKKLRWWKLGKSGRRHYRYDYDAVPLDVHGGLTFAHKITKHNNGWPQGFTKGYWVGWDYGHFGDDMYATPEDMLDAPLKLQKSYIEIMAIHRSVPILKEHKWTEEEVEAECKIAIDKMLSESDTV